MTPPLAVPRWTADIALRMRRHFLLKVSGITAFTWLFFIGYFHTLRHPVNPVTTMPLTALDHWLPFQPSMLAAYVSLWIYVGIAPGLLLTLPDLLAYGFWIALLCVAGLGFFYLWPTEVPAPGVDASAFPGFGVLQGVDATGNACPSLHVAVALFSAVWIEHLLRQARVPAGWRVANVGWFVAIVYSTLAIKQHVALDALAGALLAAIFVIPSLRWRPQGGWPTVAGIGADIIERRG